MLVYFVTIWTTYCMAIWHFCGNLVYFPPCWYAVPRKIWQLCFQLHTILLTASQNVTRWIKLIQRANLRSFEQGCHFFVPNLPKRKHMYTHTTRSNLIFGKMTTVSGFWTPFIRLRGSCESNVFLLLHPIVLFPRKPISITPSVTHHRRRARLISFPPFLLLDRPLGLYSESLVT
jgi:hypothetical protein